MLPGDDLIQYYIDTQPGANHSPSPTRAAHHTTLGAHRAETGLQVISLLPCYIRLPAVPSMQ